MAVTRRPSRYDFGLLLGLPAAILIFVLAQVIEGGRVSSLWQPTAALVVFGGTAAAVLVSYPFDLVKRTLRMLPGTLRTSPDSLEATLERIVDFASKGRRVGLITLEGEADLVKDPFLRGALRLAIDGTSAKSIRETLEIENETLRDAAEAPAEVLETAAGYSPTLGILGAVLGLIHVMESLTEPAKLGAGIAVAFVATVYGVAAANLILLPIATKIRGRAQQAATCRDMTIEGVVALQEGLNPRLIEQRLAGYLTSARRVGVRRQAA